MSEKGTFSATFTVTQEHTNGWRFSASQQGAAALMRADIAKALAPWSERLTVTVESATFTPTPPRYAIEPDLRRDYIVKDTRAAGCWVARSLTHTQAEKIAALLNEEAS